MNTISLSLTYDVSRYQDVMHDPILEEKVKHCWESMKDMLGNTRVRAKKFTTAFVYGDIKYVVELNT